MWLIRDGVSEGEFEAVLNNELEAIKKVSSLQTFSFLYLVGLLTIEVVNKLLLDLQACESLGWGSRLHDGQNGDPQSKRQRAGDSLPKVTFIVVQKRHHTRFFPKAERTKNGNILPGECQLYMMPGHAQDKKNGSFIQKYHLCRHYRRFRDLSSHPF